MIRKECESAHTQAPPTWPEPSDGFSQRCCEPDPPLTAPSRLQLAEQLHLLLHMTPSTPSHGHAAPVWIHRATLVDAGSAINVHEPNNVLRWRVAFRLHLLCRSGQLRLQLRGLPGFAAQRDRTGAARNQTLSFRVNRADCDRMPGPCPEENLTAKAHFRDTRS